MLISVSASGLEKMTGHSPGVGNPTVINKQPVAFNSTLIQGESILNLISNDASSQWLKNSQIIELNFSHSSHHSFFTFLSQILLSRVVERHDCIVRHGGFAERHGINLHNRFARYRALLRVIEY